MKRLARALSLLVITVVLAIGSLVAAPSWALAANQYPTAAEVYVSGEPMSAYTGNHASYDASTGTLTLTNQVMGVSVVSDRNIPLDLNIVVDGNVPVYGRTNLDWMHPRLVGIDNNTGSGSSRGNINITLTAGSKLSVNCVTLDETPAINRSLTEATGISCSGTVTLTGPEGSEYSVYVRSDWHENVDGQSTLMSVPNLATTGIKAGAGLNIEGAASGNIRIQNHGAAVTAYVCSRAVEVYSGAKINVRSTGNWTFDTSSCFGSNVSAVFYIHAGKPQLVIAPTAGVVTFKTCGKADIAKFMMNGDGTTWGTDTLPEVSGHVLEIGQSQTRYTKDSRAIISTTEIKLNELPALGTSGSITADNTVLDIGFSSPRYTMSNARWWYREPGSDVWRTLGVNQLLPANATAVRASFSLEAASSYRFSYGTDVTVRFTNSAGTSTRHTTERAYMHPASDPSSGTFYVEFQLADLADQHPVETVKVWNVTAPYKGGQAYVNTSQSSSRALIPSGSQAHYEWATSLQWGTRPGNQYWTEVDEYNNEIRTLAASDTFQAGHSYRWNGIICAKPGWEFTEDTVITLNDGNVFGFNIYADGKLLHVFRTWSVPTTNIKKVEVLNQTEPVAGETAVIDGVVPDGAAYSITPGESYWYNGLLNPSNTYQLNSLPHFTGTFVADQWYSYVVCIEPDRDNGYGFNNYSNETDLISSNVDVTINGVSLGGDVFGRYFTSGYTSGKGKIFVCRTFYCTNPDAINRIEIQQTMPVAGQTAQGDAVSLTPGVTIDAVSSEDLEYYEGLGIDTSRVSAGSTSLWIDYLTTEDDQINTDALMPVFESSSAGVNRVYTFRAHAHAENGRVFAMGSNGVAATKAFVGNVPATVQLSEDKTEATITLYYTMPMQGSDSHMLFIPTGITLEREYDGSWQQWMPSVEDYNYTGYDLYDTASADMRFRVRSSWPSTWEEPVGQEFYKWYSPSQDVVFENNVRDRMNIFTMPAHDVTIDVLTQAEGTLPTELSSFMVDGWSTSDGWENPESWNWTGFDGSDQYREAVLVDSKGTPETDDDYALVKGTDYTVSYDPVMGSAAGEYTITYTGIPGPGNVGGYEGSFTNKYRIDRANIADCDITVNTSHVDDPENPGDDPVYWEYYTGAAIEPGVTITLGDYTLVEGTDYELTYYWNTTTGTATVQIDCNASNNFAGWTSRSFEIRARDISEFTITPPSDVVYNGSWQEPPATVTFNGTVLEENTDYYAYYHNNMNAGTARVEIVGNEFAGWTGTREFEFQVKPVDLSDPAIDWVELGDEQYTGAEIRYFDHYSYGGSHSTGGSLHRDYDFEVTSYSNNVYPGEATVTLKGIGNYTGTHELHFDIYADLGDSCLSYTGLEDIYTWTGQPVEPKPTVTIDGHALTEGVDYQLVYANNTAVGTGSVFIRELDDARFYVGERHFDFAIQAADISTAKITGLTNQAYTGEYLEPPFTVTLGGTELVPGVDYSVTYTNNLYVGTANVTVYGQGNYSGTIAATFQIVDQFPMHRLYNKWSGEHFYTADEEERDDLVAVGWTYEGIGWYAPTSGVQVYRLYNPWAPGGDHHYTMDLDEYNHLVSVGWSGEGPCWFSDANETVPVYREYNPYEFAHNHNYTADRAEHDFLLEVGWRDEGIGWYGV